MGPWQELQGEMVRWKGARIGRLQYTAGEQTLGCHLHSENRSTLELEIHLLTPDD